MANSQPNKEVHVQRHGQQEKLEVVAGQSAGAKVWGVTAQLNDLGHQQVASIRALLGETMFDIIRSSPLIRAMQTATGIAKGVAVEQVAELGPDTVEEWDDIGTWWGQGDNAKSTALGQFKAFPELYKKYMARVGGAILQTVQDLKPGQKALVVAHHPLVELGIAHALGRAEPADEVFTKGGILVLEFNENNQVILPDNDQFVRYQAA